ncbi:hypothetical protein MC7420_762 [Coleofasciculus chthonoplastes PCC 7420]|uniref:Uncharacterized protein n=1 Tax=Coleofasciculus chthonoplastes PCC 7420 TaxID=118168 RepID=B4VST7_9CYAN|nr:hypothetical protein MC7420_762 [Coleofasciculus chthonoplastes PCC 7420]
MNSLPSRQKKSEASFRIPVRIESHTKLQSKVEFVMLSEVLSEAKEQ